LRIFNRAAARGISEAYDEKAITDGFLEEVRHNNEVFAAFRTHSMQNAIARQMTDDKGQLKSFHQFRKDVEPLTGKYCDQWLNTEYNTAIIRAHRAADWKHFEAEKDVYPNLRWMPTTSANPDPVHARFWTQKLTLPVDDPFWDHHHPGERWGCKCTCEQTDEPVNDLGVTEDKTETASRGLKGNPGDTGKLFSEDHPYFPKDCGDCPFNSGVTNVLGKFFNMKKNCSACRAVGNRVKTIEQTFDIGESLVKLYNLDNKHLVEEVKKVTSSKIFKPIKNNIFSAIGESDKDYKRLLDVCQKAVGKGYRSYILPNPGRGRTPDIILERKGIYKVYDVKTIVGKNSVSNRLNESIGQTHRVILHITVDYSARKLANEIKNFMERNTETIEVVVYNGNKETIINRLKVLDKKFVSRFMADYKR
jgi:hypothetical protein